MRRIEIYLLFMLLLFTNSASAHDIGISKSELREYATGIFQLRVEATTAVSSIFQTPVLPDQCRFMGSPNGTQGSAWKTFTFTCDGGLLPDDSLALPWNRDGIMLTAHWLDGGGTRGLFNHRDGFINVRLVELRIGSGSIPAAAKRYTTLGVVHILEGYDHLLFVFALLLIVSNGWRLVQTITAFTLAHSITLALATLGFVQVPSRPIEATIALSIAFLAAEILHARTGRVGLTYKSPWLIAFGFGLIHGFGFAGALSEIGLPQAEIPIALLFFNIGVEMGQLLFVCAVVVLKWTMSQIPIVLPRWTEAVSTYAIGTMATYWFVKRVSGMIPVVNT